MSDPFLERRLILEQKARGPGQIRKPITVRDELSVINLLDNDCQVSMNKGIVTIDLTKNKPPVVIMLTPAVPSHPGMNKLSRHDFDQMVRGRKVDNGAG